MPFCTYQKREHTKILFFANRLYLRVSYDSRGKQRCFPLNINLMDFVSFEAQTEFLYTI
jgi:hypothetical protein